MEVFNPCMECLMQDKFPAFLGKGKVIQIQEGNHDIDTYLVEMTCDKGHHTFTFLQAFKFEFLFDLAMKEFVNERYEFAIFYFGVAKERFYWFFTKVAMRKLSGEKNLTDIFYKYIKNNSQMQEGIFFAMYALIFKKVLKFDDNIQNIRNTVIHKGDLVLKEDCEKYGKAVLKTIVETLNGLKNIDPNFYEKELEARNDEIKQSSELKKYKINTNSTECAIFLPNAELTDDFSVMVENYTKNKDLMNDEMLKFYTETIRQQFQKK